MWFLTKLAESDVGGRRHDGEMVVVDKELYSGEDRAVICESAAVLHRGLIGATTTIFARHNLKVVPDLL